ncbi:MAG: PilZ domain-containing protein [Acidobacteriales bacterium]|nr:PilZ domain-containing protein [Terriglobales bacterium]
MSLAMSTGTEKSAVQPASQPQKKAVCKAALLNLDAASAAILRDSFKQFRIAGVEVNSEDGRRFYEEKFDACVLRLEPGCETLLEAARNSPRNRHLVIYGISMPGQHLRQVSKYGINVMLNYPVERQAALRVVRSTHLLVLHEFRRYVRVPVITEVKLDVERSRYTGSTVELSGGGMSMQVAAKVAIGQVTEATFTLPRTKPISVAGVISWIDANEGTVGVRFDANDSRRAAVKAWIEEYLEI